MTLKLLRLQLISSMTELTQVRLNAEGELIIDHFLITQGNVDQINDFDDFTDYLYVNKLRC